MRKITDKQKEIMVFINRYIIDNDNFPTLESICNEFSLKSQNGAHQHLKYLQKKGFIERCPQNNANYRRTAIGRML